MEANQQICLAVGATFTVEPIEQSLHFWLQKLEILSQIQFTPYNQIFQQLLDPTSLFSNNKNGINLVLLRLEDWQGTDIQDIDRNIEDFSNLLTQALSRSKTPYIVVICPSSPQKQQGFKNAEEELINKLNKIAGVSLVTKQDLENYPVKEYYDQTRDELGNIPFTPLFFIALGTVIARKISSLKTAPFKVIALDCDNTIWKGVVGEDGVTGIEITPEYQDLQKFMFKQKQAGMLLSLCSKNIESDVLQVFKERTDLELKLDDLVSWKINWQPKSENLKALAQEMNLGLDSFIFIDDNPVECAEVRSNCPEVLTINLPINKPLLEFLNHVWVFDHLKVTEEDQQRTKFYQQNIQRERFQKETTTLETFLEGLELKIEINPIKPEQIARVAQLTQRTNQFNLTTKRYLETEITELLTNQLDIRVVEVSDRFGDYGLVGVMLFRKERDSLEIDSFLLSCRVLGRGVEEKMLETLGKIAQEANLPFVKADYIQTKKNLPVLNFLEKIGKAYQEKTETGYNFTLPTEFAATLSHITNTETTPLSEEVVTTPQKLSTQPKQQNTKSELVNQIAKELYQVELIEAQIKNQQEYNQRTVKTPYIAPQTLIERQLAKILAQILTAETIGIDDNYFELGGTSLQAVELFAEIEKEFSTRLPLTTLIEAPTIRQISQLLNQVGQLTSDKSLVLLQQGESSPPLFLVHDGHGETLLYRNLARNLQPKRTVYGLQPISKKGYPILHTQIKDMAAFYIEQMRHIQPEGPYLLGGMCAGGIIAFEMALQLQQKQQKVAMLALMDAADVAAPKQIESLNVRRLRNFSSSLNQTANLSSKERFKKILNTVKQKSLNVISYEFQNWNKKLKCQLLDFCLRQKLPLPAFLAGLSVNTVYRFAESRHHFTEKYQGDILLLQATTGEGIDQPFIQIYSDPLLGWSQRVTGEIKVHPLPGGHSSMLQEPNVAQMGESIAHYLSQIHLEN